MYAISNLTSDRLYLNGFVLEPKEVKLVLFLSSVMLTARAASLVSVELVVTGPAMMTPPEIFALYPTGSWYNFDLSTLWEQSNETVPALDGAPVGAWSDKHTGAYPVTQGSTPNKPLVSVADRAVLFVGNSVQGQELVFNGALGVPITDDVTVMAVVRSPTSIYSNHRQSLGLFAPTSNGDYVAVKPNQDNNFVGSAYMYYAPVPNIEFSRTGYSPTDYQVISVTKQGTTGLLVGLAVNGVVVNPGPINPILTPSSPLNYIFMFSSEVTGADMYVRDMIWFVGSPTPEVVQGYALYGATL